MPDDWCSLCEKPLDRKTQAVSEVATLGSQRRAHTSCFYSLITMLRPHEYDLLKEVMEREKELGIIRV